MRIDWDNGKWRVHSEEVALLDSSAHVICRTPVEFVNADQGYAVTTGSVRRMGDVLVIENDKELSHG